MSAVPATADVAGSTRTSLPASWATTQTDPSPTAWSITDVSGTESARLPSSPDPLTGDGSQPSGPPTSSRWWAGPTGPSTVRHEGRVTRSVLGMVVLVSGLVVLAAAALWIGRR